MTNLEDTIEECKATAARQVVDDTINVRNPNKQTQSKLAMTRN